MRTITKVWRAKTDRFDCRIDTGLSREVRDLEAPAG